MYPAPVEYLNRQRVIPKLRQWTLGATIIYVFPFSLFVSVYVYASFCDFVCMALLLPFVLGFCLSVFCFFCFYLFMFLIIIFYFNNFIYFILFFSFFLSFFPPLLLSCVADRVLVLWPGVRPVPLRRESRVQDIGPPETSRLHVISNGKSYPRDLHLKAKT